MVKKTFYFSFIFLFFWVFNTKEISAKEYCHFHLNNTLKETLELPFYYYEIKRTPNFTTSMPTINYSKETFYIDSLTKCELINLQIIYNDLYLTNALVADYSYEEELVSNQMHFEKAKFKENNTVLLGLSTNTDEEAPIIKGFEEKYTTNINNPLNLEELLSLFTAYDNFDGNISHKIKIKYEDYTNNLDKTGVYAIILSVEDSSSNNTTITFYIEIIDTTPPIIEGEKNYISLLSNPLNTSDIQTNLIVKDNANNDLKSQLFVCADNYSKNKNNTGTYTIFFCVYDTSHNLSKEFEVFVEVKDDISPTIEGLDYYESKLSSPLTIKEIMYSLAASDNGKDISNSIFITSDYYSSNLNSLGEKEIFFQAMDEQGNISAPFKVTINLIDDISPQIFGTNNFTSYLSNPLSITHLKQQLSVIDNFDGNITNRLNIINDSYSPNINTKGTFYITFQAEDYSCNVSEEFLITVTNIDNVAPYITGPSSLKYKLENKPSLQTILSEFVAIDNVDKTTLIEIKQEDYSSSIETGIFFIELSSQDSEGNISVPFLTKIEIVDELIEVNEASLLLPTSQKYTLEEINKLINFTNKYTLIEDTYSNNYSKEGTYHLIYEISPRKHIKISITTYTQEEKSKENESIELTKKQKKETLFSKIKSFFKNLFSNIKNFFKKIFL